ncbi:MAG: alpha-L-fucosidase [Armatimonadota bacterium]
MKADNPSAPRGARSRSGRKTVASPATFEPTWESLRRHQTPQWLRDGKFGIYTHWGPYSVPAWGGNATWYSHNVYMNPDSEARKYHEKTYGPLDQFGYKDYIPMFTAEKFDPDEWADLFQRSGARFAGPVAEHHDGFAMWDTKWSEWNAAKMGPKRDVVGELEKTIKARGMKFVTALHHAENWFFFPVWDKRYDCSDPKYSGLYGFIHERGAPQSKEFLDRWYGKTIEVIDKYDPDFIWFDYALCSIHESYVKEFLAYYYNRAEANRKEVVVTYKDHDLPPGVGLLDYELGQARELTWHEWITDSTVDDQGAWGYVKTAGYRSVDWLVDNLVDRVSKNGYLLLNVGPRADGTIPEEAKQGLLGMGEWLKVNGEAVYGTTAWVIAGEGPTRLKKASGGFNEEATPYTAEDIRFTAKGNALYATVLEWPGSELVITTFALPDDNRADVGVHRGEQPRHYLYPSEVVSITMLGDGKPLPWKLNAQGLVVSMPAKKPCDHAFVVKIERRRPF